MDTPLPHIRRVKIRAMIIGAGTLPLLIYVLIGAQDGNPLGLGLLMWLTWLVGGGFAATGAIAGAISRFRR
jgi:hypothetical protein